MRNRPWRKVRTSDSRFRKRPLWRAGSGLGLLVVLLETTGAKVFRNEKHGDVIVRISDEKVDVAATKPEAAF